jgi:hypothetical protein
MAKTYSDRVYSGTLTTGGATIATVGASTVFVIKGILISNANAADKKAEVLIDDKRIVPYVKPVPTGDVLLLTDLNIPVVATKTIKVKGEVNTDMDFYIWGVDEVTS